MLEEYEESKLLCEYDEAKTLYERVKFYCDFHGLNFLTVEKDKCIFNLMKILKIR